MNSHGQDQSSGNAEISSGAGTQRQPMTKGYSLIAILVGLVLLFLAFLVVMTGVDLPYKRLLVYAGVAALFSGIGATAAVRLDLKEKSQAGVAGGAAAIAPIKRIAGVRGPKKSPAGVFRARPVEVLRCSA